MPAAALSIRVPAEAEQLARVRADLAEYARGAGMAESGIEAALTIVTEACGNSIKHAYGPAADGFIEVNATVEDGEMCLVVRDFGSGIGPRTETVSPGLHAGLSIIGALSRSFRLSSRRSVGTELEARLSLAPA
ncbi:MAG TPA: ATP-binding protein [Solirubrobacterales bacterium]|nr:ATP-binding protein [Solirubrobacterales bacterium]